MVVCGFESDHVVLGCRLAVDLGHAGLIADVGTVNGWLRDLLEDLVVCPSAKEIFCGMLVMKIQGCICEVPLTALDALL